MPDLVLAGCAFSQWRNTYSIARRQIDSLSRYYQSRPSSRISRSYNRHLATYSSPLRQQNGFWESVRGKSQSGRRACVELYRSPSLLHGYASNATPEALPTRVVQNARRDEQGQEMRIDISPRAAKRLTEIKLQDQNPALLLRVTVEAGGCHGFQYLMSLADQSTVSATDDTVFEAGDNHSSSPPRVVMDEASLGLLKGSTVDYTMELIGSQFKITGNPAASSSCGCGTSFDVKV